MRDVVRSRFPLAISAAAIAMVFFFLFGGNGSATSIDAIDTKMLDPKGALMLVALVVVVIAAQNLI